jgi:trk system potassium uptake protein TrkA
MRVVIIGCGRVGAGLASRLDLSGHEVTVVDVSSDAFARLGPGFGGRKVRGLGFDRLVLAEAGIDRADAVAAVTGSDEVNAVVARLASKRFRVPRVVARLYDPRTAGLYRRLGVLTVSPVGWAIGRLAELATLRDVGSVATLGAGQVDLVEAEVSAAVATHNVGELESLGEMKVVAVTREGRTFIPDSAVGLRAGDVLSVAVAGGMIERLEELVGGR